jgi:hypothetical protein
VSDVYLIDAGRLQRRLIPVIRTRFKPGDKIRLCNECNGSGGTPAKRVCGRCKGSGFDPLRIVR